jgi:hypothetical protein
LLRSIHVIHLRQLLNYGLPGSRPRQAPILCIYIPAMLWLGKLQSETRISLVRQYAVEIPAGIGNTYRTYMHVLSSPRHRGCMFHQACLSPPAPVSVRFHVAWSTVPYQVQDTGHITRTNIISNLKPQGTGVLEATVRTLYAYEVRIDGSILRVYEVLRKRKTSLH